MLTHWGNRVFLLKTWLMSGMTKTEATALTNITFLAPAFNMWKARRTAFRTLCGVDLIVIPTDQALLQTSPWGQTSSNSMGMITRNQASSNNMGVAPPSQVWVQNTGTAGVGQAPGQNPGQPLLGSDPNDTSASCA
jgi:hypothetical protein